MRMVGEYKGKRRYAEGILGTPFGDGVFKVSPMLFMDEV